MTTEIYYFSGTGNSLAVARDLAEKMRGRLTAIASLMDQDCIITEADVVGIVFPIYYATNGESGIPLIVGRFVKKLEDIGSKYLFAVCTHSGMPGASIENLGKIIKSTGGKLAAGFAVKMSIPPSTAVKLKKYLFHKDLSKVDIARTREEQQQIFENWRKKLEVIVEYTGAGKTGVYESRGALAKIIWSPFLPLVRLVFLGRCKKLAAASRLPFSQLIPLIDRSFRYDEKCNGCGICARVCPVNNIEIVGERPVWQHRCENCYACYQWCPPEAIRGDMVEYNERYHHPGVKLADMLSRS